MTVPFRVVLEAPVPDDHTCNYYCTRVECIVAQRDELRDRLARQKPVLWRLKDNPTVTVEGRPSNPDLWEPLGVLV